MKELSKIFFAVVILCLLFSCKSQNSSQSTANPDDPSYADNRGFFRIMFYNCENLFDTYDDSLKNDNEFLPAGAKYWTPDKYRQKILNICKVITGVGGWDPPEIVGLCEVENDLVLKDLITKTPLSKFGYQAIHFESPDNRGIDVAMLYLKNKFDTIKVTKIPVQFPFGDAKRTRDILYVKGKTTKGDTLHVLVNHWPSRWGGQLESEPRRIYVASVLRHYVDSIFANNNMANIVIVGDLNDGPDNKSVIETLNAKGEYTKIEPGQLYNLSYYLEHTKGMGSHKFNGEWGILDHLIVSGGLLSMKNSIYTTLDDAHIYKASFLLEKDNAHFGFKPFRTYLGYKFNGGFSDHLPVFIDIRRHYEVNAE